MLIFKQSILELQEIFWQEFSTVFQSLAHKESIMIGLSGGNSLLAFYEVLEKKYVDMPLEIRQKIRFCFVDERIVPLYHIDSNYRLCCNHLFESLLRKDLLTPEQIIKIDIDSTDIASSYSSQIQQIDIAFFGVGPDGHIASLFPQHSLVSDISNHYLMIEDSPKEPRKRITISRTMISHISHSFVFFIGESKQEALKNFLDDGVGVLNCPAKLTLSSAKISVFTDIF